MDDNVSAVAFNIISILGGNKKGNIFKEQFRWATIIL